VADFIIYRGDTVVLSVTVTVKEEEYSLVGAEIWFTAKPSYSTLDAAAQFQKTIGDGIAVTDAAKGKFTVTISATDTYSMASSKTILLYDCQVKESGGNVYTIASGNIIVMPDVTRAT